MIPSDPAANGLAGLPLTTNELFAMVAEHTQNAAIVTDLQYRICWANAAFTKLTGYTLDEVRGRNPAHFLRSPDSDAGKDAEIKAALAACRSFSLIIRNQRKNGSAYWIRLQGQPLRDAEGAPVAFMTVGMDVTEQVQRETVLERNEALFNEAQRIARIGNWDYDVATGVRQWSAETCRIYGLTTQETLSAEKGIAAFIPDHQPIIEAAFNQCIRMGVPYDLELQMRPLDGEVIWVRCIGRAYTQAGRVVRVAGTLQDIDERKRAEQDVARLAERITLAAKFARIGIWEHIEETEELIWDDAMLALHGLRRAEFVGNPAFWRELLLPEDRWVESQARLAGAEGRGEFDIEYRIRTPANDVRYIRNCGRFVRDAAGRILRSYGVNYDITQERVSMIALLESDENLREANASLQATIEETRRLARAAEAANQAKSVFLATISHEIRTPLNGVIGMTNILAGTPLNGEQLDYLKTIRLSGEALLTLINDTLDYSKIEAGRVELESRPFDLIACVEESLDLVTASATQKNLSLDHLIAADLPRLIEGDASRLRQILVNLLGNAVKFTPHGRILLEARAEAIAPGELRLTFAISDTGIGIPQNKQSRLFERFFQVDASITRAQGGTGLGLAISRRLAELMGGTIRVESQEGRGSTFFVTLRAPVAVDDALTHFPACRARLDQRRVLLVGNTPGPLEPLLRQAGMVVTRVANGESALQRLAAGHEFDLILAHPGTPGMDGLDFARSLQARHLKSGPLLTLDRVTIPAVPPTGSIQDESHHREHLYPVMASLVAEPSPLPVHIPAVNLPRLGDTMPLAILMAEDNPVNQRVAQLTLRRLGYEVEIVPDGTAAIGALHQRHFDVVLMDIQMPGMDGLEAARRIRAQPASETRPWIIALTAGAFEEDRLKTFAAGMNDFLSKPLRVEQLQAALVRAYAALQTLAPETSAGKSPL